MTKLFSATVRGERDFFMVVSRDCAQHQTCYGRIGSSIHIPADGLSDIQPLLTYTSNDVVIRGVTKDECEYFTRVAMGDTSFRTFDGVAKGQEIGKRILAQLSKPLEEFDLAIASAERDFAQLSPDTASVGEEKTFYSTAQPAMDEWHEVPTPANVEITLTDKKRLHRVLSKAVIAFEEYQDDWETRERDIRYLIEFGNSLVGLEPLPEPTEFGAVVEAGLVDLAGRTKWVRAGGRWWCWQNLEAKWSDLINPKRVK